MSHCTVSWSSSTCCTCVSYWTYSSRYTTLLPPATVAVRNRQAHLVSAAASHPATVGTGPSPPLSRPGVQHPAERVQHASQHLYSVILTIHLNCYIIIGCECPGNCWDRPIS